ncbi:porin [Flexibacterium corallicola]|uniref:porin n=1 Tax=Flexibacterium corallicola TaxID=3037259 RepID=UPI00286EC5D7|nr:porin [Pseudovibrio sp. M1P-2-3]
MNFKSIALAAAAAAAATSASAADLPVVAEPVDYVQVCDAYGAGYFMLPGSDTCVRVGGRIRAQIVSGNLDNDSEYSDHDSLARGYVRLYSATQSEIGLIRTFTEIRGDFDEQANDSATIGDAYIQFSNNTGALTIGRTTSAFDAFTGYTVVGVVDQALSDNDTLQISYNRSFGNGVTATLSVEDSDYRDGANNSANVIAAVGIEQGWGSFRLAGALHNTADIAGEKADNDYGYAIQGTVIANLDAIASGTEFAFQAAYVDSAVSYVGVTGEEYAGTDYDADMLDTYGANGFAVAAGIEHSLTETVTLALDASYLSLETEEHVDLELDRTAIDASVAWSPVSGLVLGVDAGWANTDLEVSGADSDADDIRVGTRVQYTF